MAEQLCSVGLDVGTTTTQMILSRLEIENRASAFAVPNMEITERRILYRSSVHFTPLLDESHVDGDAIRRWLAREYEKAGITQDMVDTGAIIITGETSRKENAKTVLDSISSFAGDFVVATAGPDLESVLAAKGAGAVALSEKTGKTVLHMDIGGGTSNLALIENGEIRKTGCFNVGGRLIKLGETGKITYVSPVLQGITDLKVGDIPSEDQLRDLAESLARVLSMAAGLCEPDWLLAKLATAETAAAWVPERADILSFSGGVADCIETVHPLLSFGDMGPALGQAIRKSALCTQPYVLGRETIRATVIGAGCHSARLSGSTVFYRGVSLPLKNLPVVKLTAQEQLDSGAIRRRCRENDAGAVVLAMPGFPSPGYDQVRQLARTVAEGVPEGPVLVCLEQDMAKALGQCLSLLLPGHRPCLCIDRLQMQPDSYLDVGEPVGPALPVVIKTLILSQ